MRRIERYRVRRSQAVARITHALEASGATVLRPASPTTAPFELTVRAPDGEILDLICYAFTANKYRQAGRPSDEHRFQIKYGSDFARYHSLYFDPAPNRVTLFFGVHEERDLFVAADPRMHSPTWFSKSVEFKEADLEAAERTGWHGWERERSEGRRKQRKPLLSYETEVLVAFCPERFVSYVRFEQAAAGLDPGERLLLFDRMASPAATLTSPAHLLESALSLTAREILDVIAGRSRLLTAVRGGIAEHHLGRHLAGLSELSSIDRIDEDGQPDFEVGYKGRRFRIECKNTLRRSSPDAPRVDFQKTRAAKGDPCSRYYKLSQFEVLAACLHPVTESWEFRFCSTAMLPSHASCPGRLSQHVAVKGEHWSSSLVDILDRLTSGV